MMGQLTEQQLSYGHGLIQAVQKMRKKNLSDHLSLGGSGALHRVMRCFCSGRASSAVDVDAISSTSGCCCCRTGIVNIITGRG